MAASSRSAVASAAPVSELDVSDPSVEGAVDAHAPITTIAVANAATTTGDIRDAHNGMDTK